MVISLVIRGGTVYDGTGVAGHRADVLVEGDRIVAVEAVDSTALDVDVIDATGLAVTPGFVNTLSHAWASLQHDPSGASELMQGVTTQVFGEAFSLGPSNEQFVELVGAYDFEPGVQVVFDRLSEGLSYLAGKGVAQNIASFIGGDNLRILGAGLTDRPLDRSEIDRLRGVVAEEMQDGALGIGTALIYPPGHFADTDELVALCEVVGEHDGMYISHMRSEGDALLEGLDELLEIGQRAQVRTELYHFKAAGMDNWPKMARAIERIEHARASGQQVTADMYPYVAGATGLMASIPPKYHDGGPEELQKRLADPAIRTQMAADIRQPSKDWENLYLGCGDGSGVLFFKDLADGTPARGRRLSEVAADLGLDHVDALLEIVARDLSVGVAYFDIDEDNVRLGLQQEWVSVGSDAEAFPATPPWTDRPAHPRTFGAFARFLGRYGRDQGLFSLTEGVRRMTSLPAGNFRLRDRGRLVPGAFADIAVFDADAFIDHATFAEPHQYATGMRHVLVNGVPVLRDEKITGAAAGRHLRRGA